MVQGVSWQAITWALASWRSMATIVSAAIPASRGDGRLPVFHRLGELEGRFATLRSSALPGPVSRRRATNFVELRDLHDLVT